LWARLDAGEDFWSVVREGFKAHEITRGELIALIDRGLQETRGSYRALVRLFNLPPGDYKRFHAYLYQHDCNLPIKSYRLHMKGGPASGAPRAERKIAG
jgi:hypothetical protein